MIRKRFGPLRMRRLPSHRGEKGFTLVEVMVAFLIIAIVAAAGTSLTVRGLRSTLEAKQLTQAKNLVSAQTEEMRGLPYFVAFTTSTSKVDVLDRYFPTRVAPASGPICTAGAETWLANRTAWSGYVAAGGARCMDFEPATGAFYRTVVDPAVSGSAKTALVVATQFIGLAAGNGTAAPVVDPATTYAWNATGMDAPASGQVAAHVTAVFGPPGGDVRHTTSRTDIADRRGGPPLVSAETNAAAVTVEATLAPAVAGGTGTPLRLELGTVAGNGAVTFITKAAVEAVGASMQTEAGRVDGAAEIANSPGTVSGSANGGALTSGGLSIGATRTSGVSAMSTVSDPGYGSAVASAAGGTFSFDQAQPDLGLDGSNPIVRVDSGGTANMPGGGSCPAAPGTYGAAGSGWMNTGIGSPATLAACAQSAAATVQLFPTAFAPDGLIQVVAENVIARCEISGSSRTATTSGRVTVRWLTAPTTYAEATVALNGTNVTGALPDLTTTQLVNGKKLGDYIGSWAAFDGVEALGSADPLDGARMASARVPAALTVATMPMRNLAVNTPDPDSAVKVSIGRALCSATDRR
jgi:prepilin-type N-terminal cleavage/methylation domain-containing protein